MNVNLAELRKRAEANMKALAGGEVRRRTEAERAERLAHRQAEKDMRHEARARLKVLHRHIAEVTEERDGIQSYLDEMLNSDNPNPLGLAEGMTQDQLNGWIEETDHALEGCTYELVQLIEERERLEELFS